MKWEYLVEDEDTTVQSFSRLNELGNQGWELVIISKGLAFFKRPVRLKDDDEITVFIGDAHFKVKAGDIDWAATPWSMERIE